MLNFTLILDNSSHDTFSYTNQSSDVVGVLGAGRPGGDLPADPGVNGPASLTKSILLSVVLGCIVVMTICGNVLVLLAVYVNSHLRSTTNYFIVNLAIADLLLGITVLPFSATLETMKYWPFGFIVCDLWASADVLWCTASIMTLCVISIDRYIGVTRPLQHSTIITEKRAFLIIVIVWVLSVIISIAPLIGWKEARTAEHDPRECTVTKQTGYVIFSVSGSFYIPMLIIVIVYTKIYREATQHSKFLKSGMKTTKIDEENGGIVLRIHTGRTSQTNLNQYQSSSSSEHSEGSARNKISSKITLAGKIAKFKREKKAAKTLGIVVGVFIICWFPFFFCLPLDVLCRSCRVPGELFTAIFWLGYCNSLMNPIIYASSSKEFKRAFIRVLRCQYKRKPRSFLGSRSNSTTELRQFATIIHHRSTRTHSIVRKGSASTLRDNNFCVLGNSLEPSGNLLRVYTQDQRNSSTPCSHTSDKSSLSDLGDEEYSGIMFNHSNYSNCSRVESSSQRGSFSKDENYINAFRNMAGHTEL